ncbi:MAG: TIGR03759 family integrating conjugative element protein [Gammaproteobacteria bacterium]
MRSGASELGALGVALAASSALLLVCPARLLAEGSRTASEATRLERSTSSTTQAEQARRWAITVEDWQRYERLMSGPRGTWSPHLDPVTALGVHAESDAERRRYAEILVRLERERTEREFAFERMVQQVKRDLPFDPAKLEELLVQARTREPPFRAGDRLLLFVNLECADCNRLIQHLVGEVQSLPGLHLDVYAVGAVRDEDIQAWAQKLKLPQTLVDQGRLTLNQDQATLNRLTRDPTLTVPVLIRARGEAFEMLPNDPIVLARWSAR